MQVQSSDVFLLPTRRLGPEPTFQDEIDKLRKEPWHTRPAFVDAPPLQCWFVTHKEKLSLAKDLLKFLVGVLGPDHPHLKTLIDGLWLSLRVWNLSCELNQPDRNTAASVIPLVDVGVEAAKVFGEVNSNFKVPDWMDFAVEHVKSQLRNKPLPWTEMFLSVNEPGSILVQSLKCAGFSFDSPEFPSLTAVPVASAPNLAPADAKPAASFAPYGPVFDPTKLLGGVYQGFKVPPNCPDFYAKYSEALLQGKLPPRPPTNEILLSLNERNPPAMSPKGLSCFTQGPRS